MASSAGGGTCPQSPGVRVCVGVSRPHGAQVEPGGGGGASPRGRRLEAAGRDPGQSL